MTTVIDVEQMVAFVNARLDEDEAAARAATAGPWSYNPAKVWLHGEAFERYDLSKGEEYVAHGGPSPFTGCVAATGPADHPQSMADAAHIARHDPARVLRQIDAIRAHVADYRQAEREMTRNQTAFVGYQADVERHKRGEPVVGQLGVRLASLRREEDYLRVLLPALDRVLRADALAWSDHPEFRLEWR